MAALISAVLDSISCPVYKNDGVQAINRKKDCVSGKGAQPVWSQRQIRCFALGRDDSEKKTEIERTSLINFLR
ncbi:MAG: hypothetical protein JSU83_17640 [Deltaproteobacteria bacterium]|nr:MAG: hypothetical protein JSU83_17640 [Deltaproteobacteria bacterium]